jgi:zinc protease
MVFKGTATRGPAQVSQEIADAGGEINAYTSNDRTVFHAVLPAARWQVGLDVLADAVFQPAFPKTNGPASAKSSCAKSTWARTTPAAS